MKLSEMFTSLSQSAQNFEAQLGEWQKDLSNRGEALMASAQKWRADAEVREKELNVQFAEYFDTASDKVKAQWVRTKADWDDQVAKVKAKSEEWSQSAKDLTDDETADWYEAYAAHMVKFAQQIQEEASKAVASAAEARAKAGPKDADKA